MNFEKTIADNYSSYIDDELGYNYQAWDITSLDEIRSHDRIVHASAETLRDLDATSLNDLERWALARACRKNQQIELFFSICAQLIASNTTHPALNYAEILENYLEELARAGRLEQARIILSANQSHAPSSDLPGKLALLAGDEQAATNDFESLASKHPDDAELRFDIAENFALAGFFQPALQWLQKAQQVAEHIGDQALLVDIELLRLEITAK